MLLLEEIFPSFFKNYAILFFIFMFTFSYNKISSSNELSSTL